jgi:hypothetical protein
MKTFFILVIVLSIPFMVSAQNKELFDLNFHALQKTAATAAEDPIPPEYLTAGSEFLEVSLIRDGFFTIGTTNGTAAAALDDNCQIAYGHPYAMTSFPVFKIDGTWHRFDTYSAVAESLVLARESGTLMLFGSTPSGLYFEFFLVAKSVTPGVEITLRIGNQDTVDHAVGGGLFFDPALGHQGDGALCLGNDFISNDTVFQAGNMPADSFLIWEKRTGAKGLGIKLDFLEYPPEKIIAANWDQVYEELSPDYVSPVVRALYDLMLKIYWPEDILAPGELYTVKTEMSLRMPDFSSTVFCRWDLPSFFSMENNLLFPDETKSLLSMTNTGQTSLEDLTVNILLPLPLQAAADTLQVTIGPEQTCGRQVRSGCDLVYEDVVVEAQIEVRQGALLLDRIVRPVFIPATPLSDTGLVILNDSVSVADFPDIDIIFSCAVNATGQRLLNLNSNNIFLYENDNRMRDFTFGKYQAEGADEVDFVFVLDVTGSMGDEISDVKNNIVEFADSLTFKGIDYRLGMVTFLDVIENVYNFTGDVNTFKGYVDQQYAHGGGDGAENSLDALFTAAQMTFRPAARRIFIWITDNEFHETDWATSRTAEAVVNELLQKSVTVHCVGSTFYQTTAYNRIIIPLSGNFYDIYGNFRDVLLDIANMKIQDRYELNYTSNFQSGQGVAVKLEVHYGGLGVIKTYNFTAKAVAKPVSALACYPNPFNPKITLEIQKDFLTTGELKIYDILGRQVYVFRLGNGINEKLVWEGKNSTGLPVGSGLYFVQLVVENQAGQTIRESAKILYLK